MSVIVINSVLVLFALCAVAATLNKILHPQHRPIHQFLRTVWVLILALMITVCITAPTAQVVEKELTLRAEFSKLQLQILQLLKTPAPPKLPGA